MIASSEHRVAVTLLLSLLASSGEALAPRGVGGIASAMRTGGGGARAGSRGGVRSRPLSPHPRAPRLVCNPPRPPSSSFTPPTADASTTTALSASVSSSSSSSSTDNTSSSVSSRSGSSSTPPVYPLVDVDANLNHAALREEVGLHLSMAAQAGVLQVVTPGSTVEDSSLALALARQYPGVVYPTAGIHPYHVHECGDVDDAMREVEALVVDPLTRCVGETGLDFSEGFPEAALQLPFFERQVQMACRLRKPLFLHERLAFEPFVETLTRAAEACGEQGLPPCLVHCFTGELEHLLKYLDLGFMVGITGFVCKDKHGKELRDIVKHIPLDRLVVETDAPYLGFPKCRSGYASKPKQQHPNVPSALPRVVAAVAQCLGKSEEEVARASTANARRFFDMTAPGTAAEPPGVAR